jgi:hypothetical protein
MLQLGDRRRRAVRLPLPGGRGRPGQARRAALSQHAGEAGRALPHHAADDRRAERAGQDDRQGRGASPAQRPSPSSRDYAGAVDEKQSACSTDTYTQVARAAAPGSTTRSTSWPARHAGRRGAPGTVEKLFFSKGGGGITAYVRSPDGQWLYYYAHLDAYAPGLKEGQRSSAATRSAPSDHRQRQSRRPAPPLRHQPDEPGRELVRGHAGQSLPAACRKRQGSARLARRPAKLSGRLFSLQASSDP